MTTTQTATLALAVFIVWAVLYLIFARHRRNVAAKRKANALRVLEIIDAEALCWSVSDSEEIPRSGVIQALCRTKSGKYFFYFAGASAGSGRILAAAASAASDFLRKYGTVTKN
jgi:hypothetical protein